MTLVTHTLGEENPDGIYFKYYWAFKGPIIDRSVVYNPQYWTGQKYLFYAHFACKNSLWTICHYLCVLLILVAMIKKYNSLEFKCSTCWLYYKAPASKCLSCITLQHVLFLLFFLFPFYLLSLFHPFTFPLTSPVCFSPHFLSLSPNTL